MDWLGLSGSPWELSSVGFSLIASPPCGPQPPRGKGDYSTDYAVTGRQDFGKEDNDNIGGNVEIVSRPNSVNRFFRFKNWAYGRIKRHPKYAGYYFTDRYDRTAYPRSEAAATVTTPDELLDVARHSVDSDICRTIIDLDRCLYLTEKGYSVLYQGELFVAERVTRTAP